ncbi:hypothetical protein OGM63_12410 [Plectonema radiosum NIES-515]|uniref:Uncharacterized protein n=1 Tax=Plectonema radiosum NIES-515 TaxID=2986073 RepID=A0ABT3AZZ7_9CYAN|nr:hypothetical protein [Plectonema radiosum]MCV3214305.1 hypothetical protein [Plectonema radiosum NIES-515]
MQAAHCAMVVALHNFPDDPELESARQHLEKAIALSHEYRKVRNSIFWNVLPLKAKKRIRYSCNQLAFDVYSHMIDLAHLLNQYAALQNSHMLTAPKSWQELVNNLAHAFRWIEREHPTEINSLQLSLPSVTQPVLED